MVLRTLSDLSMEGQTVLLRVDFNVPISDGTIMDDTRLRAAIPTINAILSVPGTRVVLMSHLGRPNGKRQSELSLSSVALYLEGLLSRKVVFAPDCIGSEVRHLVEILPRGGVLLLENLRFHSEEESGDRGFARSLASLGTIYVNDAFGAAHRAHASTSLLAKLLPSAAGLLMSSEVEVLSRLLANPKSPFVAVIGGAKVSTKFQVIQNLVPKIDKLLIGGAMAYTFLKAMGISIGNSLIEDELLSRVREMIKWTKDLGVELMLPCDHVVSSSIHENSTYFTTHDDTVPDGLVGVDIGIQTIKNFESAIKDTQTIMWNGPMGIFEINTFSVGTFEIARAVADSAATTVVGGGDSVAAINIAGVSDQITHVSTGGGASLELLEGRELPGLATLKK